MRIQIVLNKSDTQNSVFSNMRVGCDASVHSLADICKIGMKEKKKQKLMKKQALVEFSGKTFTFYCTPHSDK